ncbi:YgjP-like metallopeptidase domain-containing protein [Metamycoplasma subdolum]|uniref:YgjP-like metallopeptidase domain-containing protein n=1 Tax=Metamycoplasma subdolum TaxID=92407 RepID=UPI001B8629CF|nr:YgjP-like metallopeptidase domain-containing protein [Metamycoplasma subdolum]WPB50652.1 YgjP-like metallopeptidase domain-containing protein [Metamycoplasma subdolum]
MKVIFTNNINTYFKIQDNIFELRVRKDLFETKQVLDFLDSSILLSLNKIEKPKLDIIEEERYFYYFGKKINYIFEKEQRQIYFKIDEKIVRLNCINEDKIKGTIWNFLLPKLEKILTDLVWKYNEKMEIHLKEIKIKINIKKVAWGTNFIKKKLITFARSLAFFSPEIINYVVVHEMCHFFHPNHSKKFWEMVQRFCPNYKELKNNLNNNKFSL